MSVTSQTRSVWYGPGLQRSFAGACLALFLVLGLVSVPTSCDCGAGIPHGHSLFILAGHHHGADRVHFGETEFDGHAHHDYQVESATVSGAQVTSHISHASDRVALTLPHILSLEAAWQRYTPSYAVIDPVEGHDEPPDSPPPRVVLQG